MSNFVDVLTAEIAALEEKLHKDPTYVRLQAAKELLSTYGSNTEVSLRAVSTKVVVGRPEVRSGTRPLASGMSGQIASAVREYLADKTDPVPTREIMDMLLQRGIEITGSNPQNTVSSILSKSEDIQANGRAGWTLKRNDPPIGGSDTGEVTASPEHKDRDDTGNAFLLCP